MSTMAVLVLSICAKTLLFTLEAQKYEKKMIKGLGALEECLPPGSLQQRPQLFLLKAFGKLLVLVRQGLQA